MLEPLIGFSIFFLLVGLLIFFNNKHRQGQYNRIIEILAEQVVLFLPQVKSETFTSGAKDRNYLFEHCDLYATDNAIIIFGYSKDSMIKQLSVPLILTNCPSLYFESFPFARIVVPKRFNPNSFNEDVFIEFGESGLTTTNVEIRLKNIPKIEKDKLNEILQSNCP